MVEMQRIRIPEIVQDDFFVRYNDRVKINLERLKKARDQNLDYDASKDIGALFTEEPFFARFSSYVKKVKNWDLPFAAMIKFRKLTAEFSIEYNPFFFLQLNSLERKMIWAHEFFHMILEHLTARHVNHKFFFWATDLAINSMKCFHDVMKGIVLILPDGKVTPLIVAGQNMFEGFPGELAFEEYFGLIQNDPKFLNCPDPFAFDDHSFMVDLNDPNANVLERTVLRDILNNSKNGLSGKEWGNIGAVIKPHVVSLCDVALKPETVFKYFIQSIPANCNKRSWTKVNRRKRYIRPGKTCEKICSIGLLVDESGSVDEILLGKIASFMSNLADTTKFWVIPHDCHVNEQFVFEWQEGQKLHFERKLQGGTDFNAPLDYIKETNLQIDGVVFCTDLCAPLPRSNNLPRIWITSRECQIPAEFSNETILMID